MLFYSPEDDHHAVAQPTHTAEPEDDESEKEDDDREVIREVLQEIEQIGSSYA